MLHHVELFVRSFVCGGLAYTELTANPHSAAPRVKLKSRAAMVGTSRVPNGSFESGAGRNPQLKYTSLVPCPTYLDTLSHGMLSAKSHPINGREIPNSNPVSSRQQPSCWPYPIHPLSVTVITRLLPGATLTRPRYVPRPKSLHT